jgi:hypothetical protein
MVTSAELDQIRADVGVNILDHVCDIQRNTGSVNADGHKSVDWTDHIDNLPCHLAMIMGGEILGDQINVEQIIDFINMPFGTDVTAADRITQVRNQKGEVLTGILKIRSVVKRSTHLMVFAEAETNG